MFNFEKPTLVVGKKIQKKTKIVPCLILETSHFLVNEQKFSHFTITQQIAENIYVTYMKRKEKYE